MKIGVSTASFYPLETERSLEAVAKAGVTCTELFFNATCELEPDFVGLLCRIRDTYGIEILSVHPTMSLAESFMLFSAYDRRKKQGLKEFYRYGEIAAQLGAKYVILHGGKPNGILNDEEYFERFAEIAAQTASGGAVLLQENVAKFRAGDLSFLQKMAAYLGEQADFCLDVKQCLRGGYSPFEAVQTVGKNIRHLHLSDHSEQKDCLLPGNGIFDFPAFFSALRQADYKGDAVIEVYENAYRENAEIFASCRWLQNCCDVRKKT